jgi:hypothetical protein
MRPIISAGAPVIAEPLGSASGGSRPRSGERGRTEPPAPKRSRKIRYWSDVRRNVFIKSRAPARLRHRHVGRERPRRPWAAFAARGRGRSRPFLAATPVLGRLPGGTYSRPPGSAQLATTSAPSVDCGASMTAVAVPRPPAGCVRFSGSRRLQRALERRRSSAVPVFIIRNLLRTSGIAARDISSLWRNDSADLKGVIVLARRWQLPRT